MKRYFHTLLLAFAGLVITKAQYTIYPIPQTMEEKNGTCSFTTNVDLICDSDIDEATVSRAKQVFGDHGITVNVTTEPQSGVSAVYLKVDASVAVANKYDSHKIELASATGNIAQLTITGQNTDAVFFGLASLEQMLDQQTSDMPCVSVSDYADQQQRGIVEGYYGYPYSVAVKKDLMKFMMRMKMNTYLYGAKSDPYHSEYWSQAYPQTITAQQEENGWMSQDMIRDVCNTSAATKVNFIWAIHPGNSFLGSTTVVNDIMGKFDKMYKLGVRQFGIFVDDVSVPSSDADLALNASRLTEIQQAIEAKWNKEGAAPADTVKPIHFVPQIYCRTFASSDDQYSRFFKALSKTPEHVVIYTTGWGVWSVPNSNDLATPKQYLGRNVAWWWNYPCNDNADARIYPVNMYSNFDHMPAVSSSTLPSDLQNGIGIVSNPMQQGEVAKIPLFSVADYAWNNSGYNNMQSWEDSFSRILDPTHAQALKTIAPYLTTNDEENTFGTSYSTESMKQKISTLLDAIKTTHELETSEVESDKLMWRDLKCWVLKLEDMLHAADKLIAAQEETDSELRWQNYADALNYTDSLENKPAFEVYSLEGMGTGVSTAHRTALPSQRFLAPYINTMRTTAMTDYFAEFVTNKESILTNTSYTPIIYNKDGYVYTIWNNKTYEPGEYIGLQLSRPQMMSEVVVSDALCKAAQVTYSADGYTWKQLSATGSSTKEVEGMVKYLVITNTSDETVKLSLSKSSFHLKPLVPSITGVTVPDASDYNQTPRTNFYDGNYSTWWSLNKNQASGETYTIAYDTEAPVKTVRVGIGTVNGDYMQTGRIEISRDGKTWVRLSPEGMTKYTFNIGDMKIYSSECKVLDFPGKNIMAKYIRLTNVTANTNKWLRIFELQPIFNLAEVPAPKAEEACDGVEYTYTPLAANDTLKYTITEVRDVKEVRLYTDKGIITLQPDLSTTGSTTLPIVLNNDVKIYEIVLSTSDAPDEITAVKSATDNDKTTSTNHQAIYDLQGRRLKSVPTRGIYIQGGKKIVQ